VAATATAVSVSSLLFLTDVAAQLQPIPNIQDKLTELEPGDPQTILIVGSDKRANTPGDPGRSDTTMLLRVDAEKKVLSLFSLPRDLRVDIAGKNYGEGRLNEAFTAGGVQKTLATVQDLTGLEINHVVNVDFQGFADAVDAIGCVYVDIDRDYFNDNSDYGEDYATIDVNAGYQRLCGLNALDYVRYRHTDTTFVRDARQQDFLRNARAQVPVSKLAPPVFGGEGGSSELIDIFTEYTSSDIHTSAQVIGLLKAFLIVKDVPINEVHFKGTDEVIDGAAYVTATQEDIQKAVDEFLGDEDTKGPRGGPGANAVNEPAEEKSGEQKAKEAKRAEKQAEDPVSGANVISTGDSAAVTTGGIDKYEAFGRTSARRLKFPIYIPNLVVPGSSYDPGSRQYDILDLEDDKQPAYKMVIALENPAINFEYYGIQGTTWADPPILEDPSETRTYDGREYDLYYDGDRLRMVAFHDGGNAYWVSNTLLQTLDESQMLAIATSMTEVKEPDEKK
jgi:LCP family protein required for cell wall assembly